MTSLQYWQDTFAVGSKDSSRFGFFFLLSVGRSLGQTCKLPFSSQGKQWGKTIIAVLWHSGSNGLQGKDVKLECKCDKNSYSPTNMVLRESIKLTAGTHFYHWLERSEWNVTREQAAIWEKNKYTRRYVLFCILRSLPEKVKLTWIIISNLRKEPLFGPINRCHAESLLLLLSL